MTKLRESTAAYTGPAPPGESPVARLCSKGANALSVMELLALVMGRSAPDAQHFLASFNNLPSLARANVAELQRVHGVGPAIAARVLAAFELGRRNLSYSEERQQVRSPADAYNVVAVELRDLDQERFIALVLDTKNYVLSIPTVYIGSLNTSIIRIGEVFRHIMKHNAAAVVFCHNHPTGDPTPSPEDVVVTTKLIAGGKMLDIEVLDHIVIGQNSYVSMKERQLGFK